MKVLLIVDVQNDFLPGGALPVNEGDQIIDVINLLQEKFDVIIATKDWHPIGHVSFAETHGKKPGEIIEVLGFKQELWPVHCIQHTPGSEFPPLLKTEKISQIFYKGTNSNVDSYSAFFDNAHLRSTGLAEYLKNQGYDEIYVAGLATDYCVKFSVMDACELKFKTYVILDACRGIDHAVGEIDRALEEMKGAGAKLITTEEILQSTENRPSR